MINYSMNSFHLPKKSPLVRALLSSLIVYLIYTGRRIYVICCCMFVLYVLLLYALYVFVKRVFQVNVSADLRFQFSSWLGVIPLSTILSINGTNESYMKVGWTLHEVYFVPLVRTIWVVFLVPLYLPTSQDEHQW